MNMFKPVEEYARAFLDLYYGDTAQAQAHVFEAAKTLPQVPNRYWRDVFLEIAKEAVRRDYPVKGS